MKIGILSDIHGDFISLRKALQFFETLEVQEILCAGDLVEKGPYEDRVVAEFRARSVLCVEGNHDENAVRHHRLSEAMQLADEVALLPETIAYLNGLPHTLLLDRGEERLLVTHAAPSNNACAVFDNLNSRKLSKRFKKDLATADCSLMILGHTHYPFDITFRGKRVINPGAACKLKARDSHTCGILDLANGDFSVYRLEDLQREEIFAEEAI